jgi:DNA polymerase-3 subunit beta
VERADFAKAVDRVSTISSERGPRGEARPERGQAHALGEQPGFGQRHGELEVDYEAAALDIGFNASYLLDITGQLDGDTALFRLADPGSPTVIQDPRGLAGALRADADAGLKPSRSRAEVVRAAG